MGWVAAQARGMAKANSTFTMSNSACHVISSNKLRYFGLRPNGLAAMRQAIKTRKKGFIVAIDGPAGAGKSTVSRILARKLGGKLLDTGAMYRAVAYHALRNKMTGETEVCRLAKQLQFHPGRNIDALLVNGKNPGRKLRTEAVGKMASFVSRYPGVRHQLTTRQREIAKGWSRKIPVVVEGRDIGTVVFPDVEHKFYITASATVRAKRRYKELKAHGAKGISLREILKQVRLRDKQDSTRKCAPLCCARSAIMVDTSRFTTRQVVEAILARIGTR